MAKRQQIAEALTRSSGSSRVRPEAIDRVELQAPAPQPEQQNPHYRPSRQGKSNVTGYFPLEVKKQLRLIAAEEDKTIQQLLGEALNMLFVQYGRAEIAPTQRE